jgi:hypothetical protein
VSNDVAQVQRAVSETAGDLLQESLALVAYTVLVRHARAWRWSA